MDPLTVTATFITLATFIKDLIEVGESIRRSIEKVHENRRQIRQLTEDVVHILYDLANLTRGHEDVFQGSELLSALENLKAEMLYVHSKCCKISVVQLPGFRGVRSQFKAWRKRDDLEGKIGRLKEHMSKCYSQFTAFSVARIEQNTFRIEQTLIVNNVENQVKARRLEGLMAQVLLETQFGRDAMSRTMEIISGDPNHNSLESQYISAQALSLIASLERLLTSGKLVLDAPLFDPVQASRFLYKRCTPLHLLHRILGLVIDINENRMPMKAKSMGNLGVSLSNMGMASESIAWERFKIRMLHHLDCSAATTLPDMAHALTGLSIAYHRQHQFQSAIQAGQQSLDLWHRLSDNLPEVDIRICLIMVLTTQTRSLLEIGQKIAALSIAQEAVALSRPMLEQITESRTSSSVDEVNVDWSCGAIFDLAKALSSLDRHVESYTTWKEGFLTFVRLPVLFLGPPSGEDIDSFLDQICKAAERGMFPLAMLVDCVILFRSLARTYPEDLSSQFLSLLHAYAYFAAQQDDPPAMENIRLFLEPNSDRLPPELDVTRSMDISLGRDDGIQIEDAVRAFYTCPCHPSDHFIRNILITHFDEAIAAHWNVVKELTSDPIANEWVLHTINEVIPFFSVSIPSYTALLQLSTTTIDHFGTILAGRGSKWKYILGGLLQPIFPHLWRSGLLDDALKICDQIIDFLDSHLYSDDMAVAAEWHLNRHFILCDMGRFSDAIGMIQQATIASVPEAFFLHPYIAQIRILRRVGGNQEALQLLKRGVVTGCRKYWTDNAQVFRLQLNLMVVDSATAWGNVGHHERALKDAEQAVAGFRKDIGPEEEQKCVLIHSLITLSNCQATLRRNDEALVAAQEAVLIYTENAPDMWKDFIYTIRKQELGANAFHALSLRLVTSGKGQPALLNAEKATELYRELVALAPRHLPTLASSLRNLGSILWDVGRRDEAFAACEEAVRIMRSAAKPETYFLPALAEALDQLEGYLAEKGDVGGAAAAAAECAEVRREFAALPSEPEFLFEKVADIVESDDEAAAWDPARASEAGEYYDASEGRTSVEVLESDDEADEYHDASEPPTSIEPSAFISEPSGRSSTSTPGSSIDDAPIQSNPRGISIAAGDPDVVVLDGSTTRSVLGLAAARILSKPLEVDVRLRLRSTLMDVLWWGLLGISLAIAWRRVV